MAACKSGENFFADFTDPTLASSLEVFTLNSADFQKQIEDGKKKAESLNRRFAKWYYVISGSSYDNLALDRSKPPEPEAKTEVDAKTEAEPNQNQSLSQNQARTQMATLPKQRPQKTRQ